MNSTSNNETNDAININQQTEVVETLKEETTTTTKTADWALIVSNQEEQEQKQDEETKLKTETQPEPEPKQENSLEQQEKDQEQEKVKRNGPSKGNKKKKEVNPAQIPRKGYFFEHDNREDDTDNIKNGDEVKQAVTVVANSNIDNEAIDIVTQQVDKLKLEVDAETGGNSGGDVVVESKEDLEAKETANKVNSQNKSRQVQNANNIKHKYNINNNNRTTRRGSKKISAPIVDEDAVWSHDRFDENEQQPKSKTEIVKAYGYDIREGEVKEQQQQQKDKSQEPIVNLEPKDRIQRQRNDKRDSVQRKPINNNVQRIQKHRVVNNSSRRTNNAEINRTKNQQQHYNSNSNNEDDDDQYYDCDDDDEDEENIEHERLNLVRRNSNDGHREDDEKFVGEYCFVLRRIIIESKIKDKDCFFKK